MQPVEVFVVVAEKWEFILPRFNLRGCSTRVASSVFGPSAETVGVFVLVREVRFYVFVGVARHVV